MPRITSRARTPVRSPVMPRDLLAIQAEEASGASVKNVALLLIAEERTSRRGLHRDFEQRLRPRGCAGFPCTLPGLGPGQTVNLTVSAILGEPGPFDNVATISAIPLSGPAVLFALGIALALIGAATVRTG